MDNPAEIKRKSVIGGATTLGSQGARIAIQVASTIVLARLLPPSDFGLVAMVTVLTAFAGLFRDMGLSAAVIQERDLSHAQSSTLFWLNVAMGLFLTTVVAVSAPLVGWFYSDARLPAVTIALSFTLFIASLGAQHSALLQRRMAFGRKALAEIAGSAITLGTSIVLALLGYGYWALVFGIIIGTSTTTACLIALSPLSPGRPTRGNNTWRLLGFGAHVTGFEFVNYFHRNLDSILIGHFSGTTALGLYNRAYQLFMLPIQNLRAPINAVAFPALSKLRDNAAEFRSYYLRVTSFLAFLSMPLAVYLAVCAHPVIRIALGSQWEGAAPIFSVLAISGFIQPVSSLRGMVLLSTGQSKRYMYWGIFNAVLVSGGFVLGMAWGPIGVAVSYAIVNYVVLYPSLKFALKRSPVTVSDFFTSIIRPAVASLMAGLLAYLVLELPNGSEVESLVWATCTFAPAYLIAFALLPGGYSELRAYSRLHHGLRSAV